MHNVSSTARSRVLVAMSGGVDSAVAAARLVDAGHDVVGVTLHLWDYPEAGAGSHGRCCAPEDQYDARRTADALGIPHFTFDRRELFAKTVVEPFVDAYLAGETPSPCAACNRGVKIGELVALADRLGAARVATGHYARLGHTESGEPFIREGIDGSKDQSYFLYATKRVELDRLVFPLGESTKTEVRAEAALRRLPGATKGESQELCFVGAGAHAYASFVEERARGRLRPGPIVDAEGRVVGAHEGVHRFTIGQRKGLGVALGKPAFVTAIDSETGTVRLGDEKDLSSIETAIEDIVVAPGVDLPLDARIRVRYRHEGAVGRIERSITPSESSGKITFTRPVRAVSRGQIAVFYDGDRVLGGARIC
ncbi:MAG TPA: tRNA 2-thiouridine(34) synthase MnmA [Labilithrix sp.]|nr:tRNA 2-thiouridine(34) synthase MnmA [Labilithrix sp.]